MKTPSRAAAALALAAPALVLQAPAASALSCADPSQWYSEAEHVFVGRIADTTGERIALEVVEVWQGPDLADRVWLRRNTAMDMWFSFSEDGTVPDGYSSPEQYVVATQADLVLGPCSLAPLDEGGYGVEGADSPRPPVRAGETGVMEPGAGSDVTKASATGVEPSPGKSSAAPLAAGGVGVAGAGALAALLWRRRRTA